jgi:hypothetical protein
VRAQRPIIATRRIQKCSSAGFGKRERFREDGFFASGDPAHGETQLKG